MHLDGGVVDFALRVDVAMEVLAGDPPVDDFHGADFQHAMAAGRLKARGLRVQNHLPHGWPPLAAPFNMASMAALAAPSTASFSAWPLCPFTHTQSIW